MSQLTTIQETSAVVLPSNLQFLVLKSQQNSFGLQSQWKERQKKLYTLPDLLVNLRHEKKLFS